LKIAEEMPRFLALDSWSCSKVISGSIIIETPFEPIKAGSWKRRLFPNPVGSIASIGLVLTSISPRISRWEVRKRIVELEKSLRTSLLRSILRRESSRIRRLFLKSFSNFSISSRWRMISWVELVKPRKRCQLYYKFISYRTI